MSVGLQTNASKIGKYRILRELGHGGMAIVYEALDTEKDIKVALKVLPPNLVDRSTVSRFHREGSAQKGLNHPNIVGVHEVGSADRAHYIALELVNGKTVRSLLKRLGRMTVDKTLSIISQACDALEFAHQSMCVHRDIKPGNIMVDDKGQAKILDFGLVHITGMTIVTQTGSVVGTPEYMSPEQVAGEEVDCRTDIYSLGVTMYEMLSGKRPFAGESPQTIVNQVRYAEVQPLKELVPDIPQGVEDLVRKAMAKDRNDRFSTIEEMGSAISECSSPVKTGPSASGQSATMPKLELGQLSQRLNIQENCISQEFIPSSASYFVNKGILDVSQVEEIYLKQLAERKTSFREQASCVRLDPETLLSFSSEWTGVPVVTNTEQMEIDPVFKELVPPQVAQRFKILPLGYQGSRILLGMVNPLDVFTIDYLEILCDKQIEPVFLSIQDFKAGFEKFYEDGQKYKRILTELGVEDEREIEIVDEEAEAAVVDIDDEIGTEAPIIKLVNYMIQQAINERASDIHIEPDEYKLRIRYRIDGALQEAMSPPKDLQTAIVSRLKIMAELDIAEKRVPQDGRIKLRVDGRNVDLRVSTLPGIYGEKVVIRVLDEANMLLDLKDLGFEGDDLKRWERIITQPYGMVLVTGPTGSGKTTTLYSTLGRINMIDTNIVTVEDPVEYRLKGITQVQVNPKAKVTFATGLRSIFRQDPDVIMVGEMRDVDTAQISIKASLTGHLVFSTLHANDAPGTIARLLDLGIAPYLVASSLIGSLAQRLVRTICPHCKEPYEPTREELAHACLLDDGHPPAFYRGAGCKKCGGTGYRGRTTIIELMEMNEELKRMIVSKKSASDITKAAKKAGMRTLRESGILKVKNGITSLEELLKRTSSLDEEPTNV